MVQLLRQFRSGIWYAAVLTFVVFPMFWIALSALKQPIDVKSPSVIFSPTLNNFKMLFMSPFNFGPLIVNSLMICAVTIAVAIPLSLMCAYALSRYKFWNKELILICVLATQFIPPIGVALPFFIQFNALNMLDTHIAVIILNLSRVVPFAIWMLKGFVDAIPLEIEEAASVDGCSSFTLLWKITTPLVLPGMITSAIFGFILSWNEFLYPMLITADKARTVIIGLVNVVGERDVPWELMSAAGMIVMIPVVALAFVIRKHFVAGLTMGAVK